MIDLKLGEAGRGWDLLNECRADQRLARVTFVICSADVYGIEEHQSAIRSMTDVHVLRKPFDIAEFEEAIAPVLHRMTAA
jgi:hypothetical protein